jgi:outer membrane receptor protein involved in Fe transport
LPWDEGVRNSYQFRYDETINRERHTFKFGGEYLHEVHEGLFELEKRGRMYFTTLPSPAEMARRFPIDQWDNPAAWDLTGLDAIAQRYDVNFDAGSESIEPWWYSVPRPTVALWFGDTWQVNDQLTLNYGVRWDDDWGAAAPPEITETVIPIDNGIENGDFGYRAGIRDHTNIAPRAGFVYNVGGRNDFVIRGGSGRYFSTPVTNLVYSHQLYNRFLSASFVNDRQPGFVTNPMRGITAEDVLSALHVTAVSDVHGRLIEEIGYHRRDYFVGQWDRFDHYPGHPRPPHTTQGGWNVRPGLRPGICTSR